MQFDATSSTTPTGSIASYRWDFGDGVVQTVQSPTVTHTYSSAGPKMVTLTVTNTGGTSTEVTFTGQTVSNNGGPSAVTQQNVDISIVMAPPRFLWEAKDPSSGASSPYRYEMEKEQNPWGVKV